MISLDTPSAAAVEDIFPAVDVSSIGHVYFGSYRGNSVSPWQTCAAAQPPPLGRITCDTLGPHIHNTRFDYVVTELTTTRAVSTHPINTRYGFGGGFFGTTCRKSSGLRCRVHSNAHPPARRRYRGGQQPALGRTSRHRRGGPAALSAPDHLGDTNSGVDLTGVTRPSA